MFESKIDKEYIPEPIARIHHLVKFLDTIYPKLVELEVNIAINEDILTRANLENNTQVVQELSKHLDVQRQERDIAKKQITIATDMYLDERSKLTKDNK